MQSCGVKQQCIASTYIVIIVISFSISSMSRISSIGSLININGQHQRSASASMISINDQQQ
eukprot:9622420-Karenia_brevis.AAC.1